MARKKLTTRQHNVLISEIVEVIDSYHNINEIHVVADVEDTSLLISDIETSLSSETLSRTWSVNNTFVKLSNVMVVIAVEKYVPHMADNKKLDPWAESRYLIFTKLAKGQIDKLRLTKQESIKQWVSDQIVKCIRVRTEYSTIVVPNSFDIRTVAKTMTTDSTWEIQVFPNLVEMENKKSNYMISIMVEFEFLNLDDSSVKDSQCYVHSLCTKEAYNKVTNSIEVTEVSVSDEELPDTLEVDGQEYEEVTDYSDLNKEVLDKKEEFMSEPVPTHKAMKEFVDEHLQVHNHPAIHDSGNEPREFDSGFKRDSDLGKAKWSLLPPFTWKLLIPSVGEQLSNFLLTGNVKELENALTSMTIKYGVHSMCDRYHGGAEKYGYFNWAKLGPLSAYLDSTGRHLWVLTSWGKIENDPESEYDHIGAAMWGLSCMVHLVTLVKDGHVSKDLIDIPAYLDLVR